MRIELERSAALAWSPNGSSGVSPLFAVGTVEGTMDASFDTSSVLELYSVHEEQGRVEQVARVESSELFTRLAWMHSSTEGGSGLLTGAHGNGQLTLWDAAALQRGEPASTALRVTAANHTRPLTAIDANPMLKNLLATAAAEELIVWDLAQLDQTPVTHHPTAQHPNFRFPVSDLAWNRCVPRIMATTSTAGSTVIWDMRSQKPVKTLPPDGVPLRCRALAWSPNQATMLATSSEDDSRPVIQLWDLRRAVSPVIDNMSGHRAGIRSLSWCADDANLLLSSGMDQRTLLWNVNSGCVLDEVDSGAWNFDVSWAIGCRSMFSCCQQGKVVLHTVHDYNPESRSQPAAANAAAAEQDPFAPAALPLPNRPPLGPAPAWLGRPAGVCFGFGGRLVSFSQQNVQVHRLQTDQSLVAQARSLDAAIDSGEFEQFCEKKAADAHDTNEQNTWRFLRAQFASNPRQSFLCELGFGNEQIQAEIDAFLASLPADSNDDDDDDDNDDDDDDEGPFHSCSAGASDGEGAQVDEPAAGSWDGAAAGHDNRHAALDRALQGSDGADAPLEYTFAALSSASIFPWKRANWVDLSPLPEEAAVACALCGHRILVTRCYTLAPPPDGGACALSLLTSDPPLPDAVVQHPSSAEDIKRLACRNRCHGSGWLVDDLQSHLCITLFRYRVSLGADKAVMLPAS